MWAKFLSKVHLWSLNILHCVILVHNLLKYVIPILKHDLGMAEYDVRC